MSIRSSSIAAHKRARGKIEMLPRVRIETPADLTMYYTPGVAYVAEAIAKRRELAYELTSKGNSVAIISDGTRLLGLGNVGAYAAITVMESKSVIYKRYAGIDAVPLCIETRDEDRIVDLCKSIEPSFGMIHLEDIESPKCFSIQDRLNEELNIPVFHDDRHGTAVVAIAGVINSLKLAGKRMRDVKIVVNGTGAAGLGIIELLKTAGANRIYALDSRGLIYKGRQKGMNPFKVRISEYTNRDRVDGNVSDIIDDTDIFISAVPSYKFERSNISRMADKPVVFALSNPDPEISYKDAKRGGALIAATGRSDCPNQINNMICYPSIGRGLLDTRARSLNQNILYTAAKQLADTVADELSTDNIIPTIANNNPIDFMPDLAGAVGEATFMERLSRLKRVNRRSITDETKRRIERYTDIERMIVGKGRPD